MSSDMSLDAPSPDDFTQFTEEERRQWRFRLAQANHNNILCHCRRCDREWVASQASPCECGSRDIEAIACWQFPDD